MSMKLLGDTTLLNTMKTFDRENMSEKMINNLGNFLKDPKYEPFIENEKVENASPAAHAFIIWVRALYEFYFVYKKVKPKKIALAISQEKVAKLNGELSIK